MKRSSLFDLWETHWVKIVSALSATALVVTVAALYINLPTRMAKAEEKIEDLKDWAKEIQGYARAQHEMNQRAPSPDVTHGLQEWDGEKCWECPLDDRTACFHENQWKRCN